MARYNYTGRSSDGQLTEGQLEANDPGVVAKMLGARGITPIAIDLDASGGEKDETINFFTPSVTLADLVIFSRQMYSLTRAGIPILRAVAGLAESSSSIRLRAALEDIMSQLERGRTLSSALHQHPKIFGELFVSVVHVGENTGQLDAAFEQLAVYLEREQETRKQITAATRYPIFVIVAIVVALIIMNVMVIPKFADMFAKFDAELPAMTQFLIGMSDFFINKWYMLVIGVGAVVVGIRQYLATEAGRLNWDKSKLNMPIVGSIFRRSLLGRFARSFSMMLRSGVPLTTALSLVADAVDNKFMGGRIIGMRQNIEKGESLTRVATNSELFTSMVLQMIAVGEETGRVDELLAEVAQFYEREVDYDLKSLTAKIEPILIGIVAAMVLVLALGIFTPMWDMMGAIKG